MREERGVQKHEWSESKRGQERRRLKVTPAIAGAGDARWRIEVAAWALLGVVLQHTGTS
jgi:hypothetical protein